MVATQGGQQLVSTDLAFPAYVQLVEDPSQLADLLADTRLLVVSPWPPMPVVIPGRASPIRCRFLEGPCRDRPGRHANAVCGRPSIRAAGDRTQRRREPALWVASSSVLWDDPSPVPLGA